jgi:hypothetical protein
MAKGMTFGLCGLVDPEDKRYMDSAKAISDTKTFYMESRRSGGHIFPRLRNGLFIHKKNK